MGADIHLVVLTQEPSGTWKLFPRTVENPDIWGEHGSPGSWYNGRNYILFGALAGVRSSIVEPIAACRGPLQEACLQGVDIGDHSFTWMTLREVIQYDWMQEIETYYGNMEPLGQSCENFLNAITVLWDTTQELGLTPDQVKLVMGFDS